MFLLYLLNFFYCTGLQDYLLDVDGPDHENVPSVKLSEVRRWKSRTIHKAFFFSYRSQVDDSRFTGI
ncbi:hypothetical cytosolic protein [Syntrophus aciditrophicus SB]|uniref:Hypothetical cytosolic protein n=1 Tax=Syntrophus aciditrophicus (strain SB) TaxID=56780 RepID=Q2LT10_SYNAS|nr:hypothetical cytosolic protein [Syntrophus aciditrophicus SB]